MMKAALFGFLLLLFSLPVKAQNISGFGGLIAGGNSFGTISFPSIPSVSRQSSYLTVYAQGSAADFEPSRFLPFDEAVKLGQEMLNAKPPLSIAEVARQNRARIKREPTSSDQ